LVQNQLILEGRKEGRKEGKKKGTKAGKFPAPQAGGFGGTGGGPGRL